LTMKIPTKDKVDDAQMDGWINGSHEMIS